MMDGLDGLTHDISTVAAESTDLIIIDEISTLTCDPTSGEPVRLPPMISGHCNNSPSNSFNRGRNSRSPSNSFNRGRNSRRAFPMNTSKFGSCDSNSYCLSCMSVIFVVLGAFITVTTLGGTRYSLGHMWSVGPIFFCVGIMMAMKCYVYLRSKREIQMLLIAETVCRQMMRLEEDGRRRLVERSQQYFNSHGITRDIFTLVSDQVLTTDRSRDGRTTTTERVRSQLVINAGLSPQHQGDFALHEISHEVVSPSRSCRSVNPSPSCARNQPPSYETITRPDVEAPPPTYSEAIALIAQQKQTTTE